MSEIRVDTISEKTSANGVAIDSVTLKDGGATLTDNITFSASGKGVHLGVTSATASNLLDDYEEGDHVISTHYAGSGSWNTTDSNDTLQYTKIGRLVHVSGRIDVDTYSSASGIGYIDAPFTPSSGSETSGDSTGLLRVAGSNGKNVGEYFARPVLQMILAQPFEATERLGEFDVIATVRGGGLSGQAGAVRHGISRALTLFEPGLRPALKSGGFLTRDPRVVERKKYGKAKARRSFQFSKR